MKFKNNIGKISIFFLISLASSGVFILQREQYKYEIYSQKSPDFLKEEKKEKALNKTQKAAPVFGFRNLFADWTFLRFIQYLGDNQARETTGYTLVPEYFEILVKHDPYFVKAHLTLSSANSIFAGKPQKTVDLLQDVLDKISPNLLHNAHYLWIYKGIDEILFLGKLQEAKHSYEMAAEWASMQDDAATRQMADRLRETAQFLATNPDSRAVQIRAWGTVLSSTSDERTQQRAINEIEALDGKVSTTPEGRFRIQIPSEAE